MHNKNTCKRHKPVISLLIAMAMIFTMLPVSAFASDDVQDTIVFGDSGVSTPPTTNGGGLILTDGSEDDPNALLECDCEIECTEEAINADCPVCATQPELCVVGVESPEIAAMAIVTSNLYCTTGAPLSGDGYVWDNVAKTLTLTDFTQVYSSYLAAVSVPDGSTIILNGTNSISQAGIGAGISSGTGDLIIQGPGSLTITHSGNGNGIYCNSLLVESGTIFVNTLIRGIWTTSDLIIEGGTIAAIATTTTAPNGYGIYSGGSIQIDNGIINAVASINNGIFASNDIVITDGTVTAANNGSTVAAGLNCAGNLSISGGTVTATGGSSSSYGFNCSGDFAMTGGTIYAIGTTNAAKVNGEITESVIVTGKNGTEYTEEAAFSGGIIKKAADNSAVLDAKIVPGEPSTNYTLYCNAAGELYKDSGFINAYTEQTDKWSGSFGQLILHEGFEFETSAATALVMPAATTIMVDGDATIASTNTTADSNYGIAVGGDLTINVADGKTLTVNVGDGCNVSSGVLAQGTFTKTGGGTLTANGGEAGTVSFGITVSMGGDFIMSGGTINANGGDVDDSGDASYGITTGSGGNFTMTAGTINATSGGGYASMGIRIYNGAFTMSGGTINSTASNAINTSYGIRNAGSFTLSGGSITATGNLASTGSSCGISVEGGMSSFSIAPASAFTMTGGTIIAHSDGGSGTIATAMSVYGGVSADGISIKGLSGSDYTIDASFKEFNASAPVTPNVIKDSSDIMMIKAKLTKDSTPVPAPTPSGGGSSNDRPAPVAPVITPLDDKSSGTLSKAIDAAANTASGNSLSVVLKNVSNFTKENAAAIIKKAKALGKPATVSSDIMSEDGSYVEVRVTVDPALITKTIRLDGYVRQSQTLMTESKFKKHFNNKLMVVSLGQQNTFGQTAKIAVKLDLDKFDSINNLFFYSYDKAANKYTRIERQSNHRLDKNGYLVFNTGFGGDIIISDGSLEKKG